MTRRCQQLIGGRIRNALLVIIVSLKFSCIFGSFASSVSLMCRAPKSAEVLWNAPPRTQKKSNILKYLGIYIIWQLFYKYASSNFVFTSLPLKTQTLHTFSISEVNIWLNSHKLYACFFTSCENVLKVFWKTRWLDIIIEIPQRCTQYWIVIWLNQQNIKVRKSICLLEGWTWATQILYNHHDTKIV